MAVTELIFPKIKPVKEIVDYVEENWQTVSKVLVNPNPGLLSAFRGWVISEDGKDVRDQYKEIVIFEWVKESCFHEFIVSEQFAAFGKLIKDLVDGPPTLQLYNTNIGPKEASNAPIVEIFRVTVSGPEKIQAAQDAWKELSQVRVAEKETVAPVTFGESTNLEKSVVVGILGWESTEDRENGVKEVAFMKALDSLRSLGELSQIIVAVDAVELPPL